MKINIAVIFGGQSVEHEISIISAMQAIQHLDQSKYQTIPIYISKSGKFFSDSSFMSIEPFKDFNESKYTENIIFRKKDQVHIQAKTKLYNQKKQAIDLFFPIVHGTNVEDGKLQGFLETMKIPVVGPSVLSGAIGQDKAVMKDILKANDINQTKFIWVNKNDQVNVVDQLINQKIGYPVLLKPANLGSSIGITKVMDQSELSDALKECFTYDNKIVIEQLLFDFEEYNISVIEFEDQYKCSVIEKVLKNEDILSYEDKYMSKSGKNTNSENSGMASLTREIPANLKEEEVTYIHKMVKESAKVLNCQSLVRFDLIKTKDQKFYINEVNNIPGSLSFYLWENNQFTYQELLEQLIELSVNKHYRKQKLVSSFTTNVLSLNSKGAK